jgi:hypothetical protein
LTLTSTGQFPPATAQVVVTFNPAPTASAGGNQTICASSSTAPLGGSAGGGATGGAWSSSGTGTFSPNATTLNATYNPSSGDVTAGTVTLTLTSTGQLAPCGAATAQVVVTIDPPLTVAAGSDQTICANSPVGIGTPTVSGGTGPYTYSWSPATGLSDQTAPNPTATVGITTTYTVTVTDAKGCMGSAPVVLTVIPRLTKRFYRLVDSQQGALRALVTVIPPPNIVIALSGTTVMLAWYPLAGHTFVVQFKNDLTDASWTNLPGVVTLNGSTATMVDSIGGCP